MRKSIKILAVIVTAILVLSSFACGRESGSDRYSRVVGEYDATQLRGSFLTSGNDAYKIGRNCLDMPVFVSPEKAWEAFLSDYAVGIETVKNECGLKPISKEYFRPYILGAQVPGEQPKETDAQCIDVALFIDIYENSFEESYTCDPNGLPL